MGILYEYKCAECGFSVYASEDGVISSMRGYGYWYKCPQCNELFGKSWAHGDIEQAVKDYSFEKDEFLADLFINAISEDFRELFRRDILWFQQEVIKGGDSKYYGGVTWTDYVFWDKLFLYLKHRKYSKAIDINRIKSMVKEPDFTRNAAYANLFRKVRCSRCDDIAQIWIPNVGCPKCGAIMEKLSGCIFID